VSSLAALSATERDQVYLSICLALVSTCAERGVQLPLVLDEPFVRFDGRQSYRLAAVLDEFGRRGHQVLVFTARQEAVERFNELRATTHDLLALKTSANAASFTVVAEGKPRADSEEQPVQRRTRVVRKRRRAG
jgi:ABC-type Mn2+/Zn2+ transport system ATPase subunit